MAQQKVEYVKVGSDLVPLQAKSVTMAVGKVKYKFRQKALREKALAARIRRNVEYRKILSSSKYDLTSDTQNQLMENTYTMQHETWNMMGRKGSGKSYSILWILYGFGNFLNYKWSPHKFLAWTGTELLRKMNKFGKPNTFFVKDEMPDILAGIGSMAEWQSLRRLSATIRKKRISIVTVDPQGRTFLESVDYYFETWDYDWDIYDRNGNIIENRPNVTRCIVSDEFHIPFGFILTGMPPAKLIKEYETMKNEFLDRQLKGQLDDLSEKHLVFAFLFAEMPKYRKLADIGTKEKRRAYIFSSLPLMGFGVATKTQVDLIETQSMMFIRGELPDYVIEHVKKAMTKWR